MNPHHPSRRQFLAQTLAGAALLAVAPAYLRTASGAAYAASPVRQIALTNLHTGERCAMAYCENGRYIPEALASINHMLRDHRTNEQHPIDPALIDLLATLHSQLGTTQPFEVISGYRSPATNAALHARSGGVASKSLHMQGKAMDIRVQGRSLADLHRTALAMGLGGVGYYPSSDFVHVDTGRVRQWVGS